MIEENKQKLSKHETNGNINNFSRSSHCHEKIRQIYRRPKATIPIATKKSAICLPLRYWIDASGSQTICLVLSGYCRIADENIEIII